MNSHDLKYINQLRKAHATTTTTHTCVPRYQTWLNRPGREWLMLGVIGDLPRALQAQSNTKNCAVVGKKNVLVLSNWARQGWEHSNYPCCRRYHYLYYTTSDCARDGAIHSSNKSRNPDASTETSPFPACPDTRTRSAASTTK